LSGTSAAGAWRRESAHMSRRFVRSRSHQTVNTSFRADTINPSAFIQGTGYFGAIGLIKSHQLRWWNSRPIRRHLLRRLNMNDLPTALVGFAEARTGVS